MSGLGDKVIALHLSLADHGLDHAFGGALALAFCTLRPRGTSDIDLNVFAAGASLDEVLQALPPEIVPTEEQRALLERDGQARLFLDSTPVDVFLDTTDFHREALLRIQWHEFAGHLVPFLGCSDLAVFKAFSDRTKDWADLEEMVAADSFDRPRALGILVTYLGGADPRIERLRVLGPPEGRPG